MIGDHIVSTLQRLAWPPRAALLIRHSERPHIASAVGTNEEAHGEGCIRERELAVGCR